MKTGPATLTCFVIPLLTTEFAVYVNGKNGKSRTLEVNTPRGLEEFHVKVKELSVSPQRWELLRALLFCLTGPRLILTKKG